MGSKSKRNGKFKEAAVNYKAAYKIRLNVLGSQHSDTITSYLKFQKMKTIIKDNKETNNYDDYNIESPLPSTLDITNSMSFHASNNVYHVFGSTNKGSKSNDRSKRIDRSEYNFGAVRLRDGTNMISPTQRERGRILNSNNRSRSRGNLRQNDHENNNDYSIFPGQQY